jgi:hypothetical protein
MTKCLHQDFPCKGISYPEFDSVLSQEIRLGLSAGSIVNESIYCTWVPTPGEEAFEELTINDYLSSIRGKTGVYHLWVDYDDCDDHQSHTMLCVYVGKGIAGLRVPAHSRSKWPSSQRLYVTFFECSNRVAKYIEQLFLDTYSFHLNKNENLGERHLFAVWDDQTHLLGTEIYSLSDSAGDQ